MKKFVILTLLAVIALGCGGESPAGEAGAAPAAQTTAAQPDIDAKKIWKVRCIACHGLYGNQGLNGAANLQEVSISLAERINIITNGRQGEKGVMTAFGEILSPEEIKAVAEYTMTFNKDL
ncbi:MAG: cytochrome c [Lewinella sp.]|nr:cytochrome c [Lewinella sp.]